MPILRHSPISRAIPALVRIPKTEIQLIIGEIQTFNEVLLQLRWNRHEVYLISYEYNDMVRFIDFFLEDCCQAQVQTPQQK